MKSLSAAEIEQFHEAKKIELDQWMQHSAYSIASRAGVPKNRIITMRWVLTWKLIPGQGDRKAKARLVVRGFQDPDLQVLRTGAPTLARHSRHLVCQTISSLEWILENGDVKTACLQGEKEEGGREVYVQPTKDVASMLGIRNDQLMKLEGSVYGLIVAPRRWHVRVQIDMTRKGWRQHQLDPCL